MTLYDTNQSLAHLTRTVEQPITVVRELRCKSNNGARLDFVLTQSGVDARLVNHFPVSALRFEIAFESDFRYRVPELSSRIEGLNSFINFQDNVLTFVLLGIEGKRISPGSGTIATIPLDHDQDFRVTSAYASFGTGSIGEIEHTIATEPSTEDVLALEQNEPNPFCTSTKIEFRIADETNAKVIVYDVDGALIRTLLDSHLFPGAHRIDWDGKDDNGKTVDAGIYLCKLYAGIYSVTKKMVFLPDTSTRR